MMSIWSALERPVQILDLTKIRDQVCMIRSYRTDLFRYKFPAYTVMVDRKKTVFHHSTHSDAALLFLN